MAQIPLRGGAVGLKSSLERMGDQIPRGGGGMVTPFEGAPKIGGDFERFTRWEVKFASNLNHEKVWSEGIMTLRRNIQRAVLMIRDDFVIDARYLVMGKRSEVVRNSAS